MSLVVANHNSILATIDAGIAESTKQSYRQALTQFGRYLDAHGWDAYPTTNGNLDAGRYLTQVLSWLQSLLDNKRTLSTINKSLAALKYDAGANPAAYAALQSKPVKAFVEGATRLTKHHQPHKAEALTIDQLTAINTHLLRKRTIRAYRDRALIALGIATALRSASLAELTVGDLKPALTIDGLTVAIRFSKTDQTGKGTLIPVARAANALLDPVSAVQDWQQVMSEYGLNSPAQPLFAAIKGSRNITSDKVLNMDVLLTDLIRSVLVDSGVATYLQATAYSSHSLRATFITLSSQAGVSEADIAAISGHKSMHILRGYDRSLPEHHAQTDYLG